MQNFSVLAFLHVVNRECNLVALLIHCAPLLYSGREPVQEVW